MNGFKETAPKTEASPSSRPSPILTSASTPTSISSEIPPALLKYKIPNLPDSFYYIPDFVTAAEEKELLEKIPKNRWHTLSHRRLQSHPTALSRDGTLILNSSSSSSSSNSSNSKKHDNASSTTIAYTPPSTLAPFLHLPLTKTLSDLDSHFDGHANDRSNSNLAVIPTFFSSSTASTATSNSNSTSTATTTETTTETETKTKAKTPPRQPNHVLINEYPPGTGITPHEDGPAYAPVVATVSLGGAVVLDVYPKDEHSWPNEKEKQKENQKQKEKEQKRSADGAESAAGRGGSGKKRERRRARILLEPRSLFVTMDDAYTACLHGIADVLVDEDLGGEVGGWGEGVDGGGDGNRDGDGDGDGDEDGDSASGEDGENGKMREQGARTETGKVANWQMLGWNRDGDENEGGRVYPASGRGRGMEMEMEPETEPEMEMEMEMETEMEMEMERITRVQLQSQSQKMNKSKRNRNRNARTMTRVSLTYRHVLRVRDVGRIVFGR